MFRWFWNRALLSLAHGKHSLQKKGPFEDLGHLLQNRQDKRRKQVGLDGEIPLAGGIPNSLLLGGDFLNGTCMKSPPAANVVRLSLREPRSKLRTFPKPPGFLWEVHCAPPCPPTWRGLSKVDTQHPTKLIVYRKL